MVGWLSMYIHSSIHSSTTIMYAQGRLIVHEYKGIANAPASFCLVGPYWVLGTGYWVLGTGNWELGTWTLSLHTTVAAGKRF